MDQFPKVTEINPSIGLSYTRRKLRVAAYCRVSTDSDDQLASLENQASHYTDYIKSNPEWVFCGLYFDEGITGTKKDKRDGLLRLLRDCESRKLDFIVTKSISRFARNTKDCLEIVRRLRELGIAIEFQKENINTGTMDSELILTILSSLAAEESVSISQNNQWSIKRRFQNGTYKLVSAPYGYKYNGDTLTIDSEKAPIVKRIFAEVLAGKGTNVIARSLNADGIIPPRGKIWRSTSIQGILENERYLGDALLAKTYTDDSFIRHHNHGEKDQYYWKDHHEAIITREDFESVSLIQEQRRKEKGIVKGIGKYHKRYVFSGVIKCGECGSTFKRRIQMAGLPGEYVSWVCYRHIESHCTECSMIFVKEINIKAAFVTMINRLHSGRNVILKPLINDLKKRGSNNVYMEIRSIEKQLQENSEQVQVLVGLMSKGYLEPALFNERNNALQAEALTMRARKTALQFGADGEESAVFEAEELLKHLNKTGIIEEFNDDVFKQYVNGITIFSPTEVGFNMKCGLCLRERMVR